MLNYYKHNHLVGKVIEAQNDSKQLFKIVNSILERKKKTHYHRQNQTKN